MDFAKISVESIFEDVKTLKQTQWHRWPEILQPATLKTERLSRQVSHKRANVYGVLYEI